MLRRCKYGWFLALIILGLLSAASSSQDQIDQEISRLWGAHSPYFSVKPYEAPPRDCMITQVNIIQRHGARFPTSGSTTQLQASVQKLKSATTYKDPLLDFLHNYTYTLGYDDQIPFGAAQSENAGKNAFVRYVNLVSKDNVPFVRASIKARVVAAAGNWTHGFSLASGHLYNPPVAVILDDKLNNTLNDHMCPNVGNSDEQTSVWTTIFAAPIAQRLSENAPGAHLDASDIPNLMDLCGFESLVKLSWSPFCNLFTSSEFNQYEYYGDLDKFYGTGYGQDLGPVQGVGYINELLARLTETPVRDNTQTNRTLDASPVTFPLNRTIYADFSHDNQMIAIYAAMGLFVQPEPLEPSHPNPKRTWITSQLTPFSGRMVVERLKCTANAHSQELVSGIFVRILVNDALQPLEFCNADLDGLCALDAFVESQSYARNDGEGDFERCFDDRYGDAQLPLVNALL